MTTIASSHEVTVRATSADGSFADEVFSILVSDVDEFNAGPVSDSDLNLDEVSELAKTGDRVGITASASDLDGSNNVMSYGLTENAGGRFVIDPTGVVSVADGSILDYETATFHNISVRAISEDGSSSDASA